MEQHHEDRSCLDRSVVLYHNFCSKCITGISTVMLDDLLLRMEMSDVSPVKNFKILQVEEIFS